MFWLFVACDRHLQILNAIWYRCLELAGNRVIWPELDDRSRITKCEMLQMFLNTIEEKKSYKISFEKYGRRYKVSNVALAMNVIMSMFYKIIQWKKYTSGPRYWNVPVSVNTGTFLVYQYCLKMWYLRSLEHAGVIQKLTILKWKNGLVLSNTHVPVSGTSSILFPIQLFLDENQQCFGPKIKLKHTEKKERKNQKA